MKVCVTASGPDLDAPLDPGFGRCPYFVIVDTETMEVESIPNTGDGAGIGAAQTVANSGASALITGRMGPNAAQILSAAGVKAYSDLGGSVKDAVERFKHRMLEELGEFTSAPALARAGMGRRGGRGTGRGGGRLGGGGGRGGSGGGRAGQSGQIR